MSGGASVSAGVLNRRVRVVVRTRPTANFAHHLIQLEEDGKVTIICIVARITECRLCIIHDSDVLKSLMQRCPRIIWSQQAS